MHLHVALVLKNRIDVKNPRHFDLIMDCTTYHGKYEPMKGSLCQAVNYCTKHDKDPLLYGIDLKTLTAAHTSKKKEIAPEIIAGKKTVAEFV